MYIYSLPCIKEGCLIFSNGAFRLKGLYSPPLCFILPFLQKTGALLGLFVIGRFMLAAYCPHRTECALSPTLFFLTIWENGSKDHVKTPLHRHHVYRLGAKTLTFQKGRGVASDLNGGESEKKERMKRIDMPSSIRIKQGRDRRGHPPPHLRKRNPHILTDMRVRLFHSYLFHAYAQRCALAI